MRVLISGATGLIGRALAKRLVQDGHSCSGLSRRPPAPDAIFSRWFAWDTLGGALPPEALSEVDAVVHLAGESVAEGRWNDERKRRIRESRTLGTRAIVEAIRQSSARPKLLLAASAAGYYGARGDAWLREEASPGSDFLAEVCVAWERESSAATELGVRLVQHRFGIVLAREGGALQKMLVPFRLGAGGRLGSGHQFFPWIHLEDVVAILAFALANETVRGPLNTVAPEPVTNRQFTEALGQVLHRPSFAVVPEFALRLGLGEMAAATLASQRVSALKISGLGYAFRFPNLGPALQDLVGR